MADNDWINGYLEAILDTGAGIDEHRSPKDKMPPNDSKEVLTAAKYFVNEVTGYDDTALYRTWIKASASKYPRERGSRMEYLSWRIWHIARKKKKLAWEDAQRMTQRHLEKEHSLREFTEDMSEDLSEGEKPDQDSVSGSESKDNAPIGKSETDSQPGRRKEKKLYIVLISLHGLVRGENMELGRDSDTGGQVKYVVELARALATMPEVYRVDLLTRQICCPEVDWSYGEPSEMLAARSFDNDSEVGEASGAYIVRIPCGPRDQYLQKELLWPHIQEFVDLALAHILNMAKVLGEHISGGDLVWPYVIHGHYADAGDTASLLSGALNVPMVLTGHSLGRNKLEQLLKQGRQSKDDINATYKIMRRLEAEELSLDAAELVITSTRQEIDEQWGLYDGFDVQLDKVLRARVRQGLRCHGRFMPRMVVIPPGMEFSNVIVQDVNDVVEDSEAVQFGNLDASTVTPVSPRADPAIWAEINRFFSNPHKPMVLALARPDPKKNLTTLLKAFGECRHLRDLANLTLVMGNRDDIDKLTGGSGSVLTTILKLVDKYDLYGHVSYPKHHKQSDVPAIYRLSAKTKGLFVNPALVEPFGLTLIEAAAHGLPMVATQNGGPVDIHNALGNGLLVDPHDQKAIADAMLKLLVDRKFWNDCRLSGLRNIHLYSWPEHCRTYLSRIAQCRMRHPLWQNDAASNADIDDESQGDSLRDIQDFSLCLSVDGDRLFSQNSAPGSELEKYFRERHLGNGDNAGTNLYKQPSGKVHIKQGGGENPGNGDNSGSRLYKQPSGNQKVKQVNIEGAPLHKQPSGKHNKQGEAAGTEKMTVGSGQGSKVSTLRRRKFLVVLAIDSYDPSSGKPTEKLLQIAKDMLKALRGQSGGGSTGLIFSTSLTGSETLALLRSGGIPVHEFDALICSSGSELVYPASPPSSEEPTHESDTRLFADRDYDGHVDYRWSMEGLRKTIPRLLGNDGVTVENRSERNVTEDDQRSSSHCLSYRVKDPSSAITVDQLRQRLRKKGLRCHVMYCQGGFRLHVIPLLASRAQALRYLFVRWGLDVGNMFVFVGEKGDTDYEELLAGNHKTVILKGIVDAGTENLLRVPGGYSIEDVAPSNSPNITTVETVPNAQIITEALKKLGLNL